MQPFLPCFFSRYTHVFKYSFSYLLLICLVAPQFTIIRLSCQKQGKSEGRGRGASASSPCPIHIVWENGRNWLHETHKSDTSPVVSPLPCLTTFESVKCITTLTLEYLYVSLSLQGRQGRNWEKRPTKCSSTHFGFHSIIPNSRSPSE